MMKWIFVVCFFLSPPLSHANHCHTQDLEKSDSNFSRTVVNANEEDTLDLMTYEESQNIGFCISQRFGSHFEKIKQQMKLATQDWEQYANVQFNHIQTENCKASNPKIDFVVMLASRRARYLARAFFPSYEKSKKIIYLNKKILKYDLREVQRLLLHELGHTLGLRHEHINPEAGQICEEKGNFSVMGPYDPYSIMHYRTCGKALIKNYKLSEQDKLGISKLYPF